MAAGYETGDERNSSPWEKDADRNNNKGHLDTYRFCDDVWTFQLKDINFKLDNQSTIHADRVKIVSMNSKRPGEL